MSGVRRWARGVSAALGLLFRTAPALGVATLCVAVLGGVAPAVVAVATRAVINGLVAHRGTETVVGVVVVVGAGLFFALLEPLNRYLQTEIARRVELVVEASMFDAVNAIAQLDRLERPDFHDQVRMAQQAGLRAPQEVSSSLVTVVESGITVASFTAALAAVSPWAALLALAAVVPASVIGVRTSRQRAEAENTLSPGRRRTLFFSLMLTDMRAAKEIRLYGLGAYLRDRMLAVLRSTLATERRRDLLVRRWSLVSATLASLLAAAAVAVVVDGVWHGTGSIGDVALALAAAAGIQTGVAAATNGLGQMTNAATLFDNFRDLTAAADAPSATTGATVPPLRDGVQLDDVWFRYDDHGPWVLQGVTVTLGARESIGVVGVNGAGKSTLVKLVCGLYRPTRGTVRWDGVDIATFDPAAYRRRFSAVFQDFMTYDMTARENIELGDLDRAGDPAAVERAARTADAHEALSALPQGYDTLLSRIFIDDGTGQRGASLSGGQWQRVAIARAQLRTDADVILLDEPSSGLDPAAEHRLARTLAETRRDRTAIMVSHRLSTVSDSDRILVIDDGVVAEDGTHRELVALDGRYAEMFALQASGYVDVG